MTDVDDKSGMHQANLDDKDASIRKIFTKPYGWIAGVEVLLFIVFGALSPNHAFWSQGNFINISLSASEILLLCVTQAILLSAGLLDLSQGAIVIFSSVVSGKTMIAILGSDGAGSVPIAITIGVLVAIAVGGLIGVISGYFVAVVGINPLIATLGMLSIATGAAEVVTNGTNLVGIPLQLQERFGIAVVFGVPTPLLLASLIIAIIWIMFARSRFGIHTLAIGSSAKAALRSGINVQRHSIGLYALSGTAAGIAGIIDLSRFTTTDISGHVNDSLAAIAGAVIGGTSLFGGGISFPGAIIGSLLAVILQVGLVVLNLQPFYQEIAIGIVLIGAVTIDRIRARKDPERT